MKTRSVPVSCPDLYIPTSLDTNAGEQILVETLNPALVFQGAVNCSGGASDLQAFGTDSLTFNTLPSGMGVTDTVLITAGPGMGESRVITNISGDVATLNEAWAVVPTSASECVIYYACSDVAIYQNTLAGDGALSFANSVSGISVEDGLNVAVDDNSVSSDPYGLQAWTAGTDSGGEFGYFNLYTDNSFFNDTVGISISAQPVGGANFADFVGNIFRGNIITGPPPEATSNNLVVSFGISISGVTPYNTSGSFQPSEILMNLFDQNLISQFQIGIATYYEPSTATSGFAGIVDAVFSDDFVSSDGSVGSIGLTDYYGPYDSTNWDLWQSYDYGTDTWQGFWNVNN